MIQIKRIYQPAIKNDGYRILVDRLWPRGLTKEKAMLDLWIKDIAPTDALRKWFAHDPKKWASFQKKYREELKTKKELTDQLKKIIKEKKNIILLYVAKDEKYNNAVVLKEYLE